MYVRPFFQRATCGLLVTMTSFCLEQLRAVVEFLRGDPGLPLACVNFAVYHRKRLMPFDDVRTLIAEGKEIAGENLESGIYPVNIVATQHDNLFTAIYPIVFPIRPSCGLFQPPIRWKTFRDVDRVCTDNKMVSRELSLCRVLLACTHQHCR